MEKFSLKFSKKKELFEKISTLSGGFKKPKPSPSKSKQASVSQTTSTTTSTTPNNSQNNNVKNTGNNKTKDNRDFSTEYYPTNPDKFKLTPNSGNEEKNKKLATNMLSKIKIKGDDKSWIKKELIDNKRFDYYDLYETFAIMNAFYNGKNCLSRVSLQNIIEKSNPKNIKELQELIKAVDLGVRWYKLKPEVVEELIIESRNLDDVIDAINELYKKLIGEYPTEKNLPEALTNPRLNIIMYSDSGAAETASGKILNDENATDFQKFWLWCLAIYNNNNIRKRDWGNIAKQTRNLTASGKDWDNIIKRLVEAKKIEDLKSTSKGRKPKVWTKTVHSKEDEYGDSETYLALKNERLNILNNYKGSLFNIKNEEFKMKPEDIEELEYIKDVKKDIKKTKNDIKELKDDIKDIKKEENKEEEEKKESSIYEIVEDYFGDDINFIIDFFNTSASEKKVFDSFIRSLKDSKYNKEETRSWNWHDLMLASGITTVDSFADLFQQIAKNIRYLKDETTENLCDLLKFFFVNFNTIKNAITYYLDSRAESVTAFTVLATEILDNENLNVDESIVGEMIQKLLSNYSLTKAVSIARELKDASDVFDYKKIEELANKIEEE